MKRYTLQSYGPDVGFVIDKSVNNAAIAYVMMIVHCSVIQTDRRKGGAPTNQS